MALAVVLILLSGLALLAVAGLGGALASVALSGFDEQSALAFEAAEAGVARSLRSGAAIATAVPAWPALLPDVTTRTEILADPPGGDTAWPEGFSVGAGGEAFVTSHRTIRAEGRARRGAVVRIEQGYFVIARERGGA
jgi:opacity protein-like surface antigen